MSIKKRRRSGCSGSKSKIWALDTEDDSKGNVYLINFYNGEEHFTFTDQLAALNWFRDNINGYNTIWATNMAYDLPNFLGDNLDILEINFSGSRFISAKIKGTQVRFYDTLNQWKISVEKMGEKIGIKKLDPNGNFNNIEYCRRDTEITWKFVVTMKNYYESLGAKLKSTVASTALNYYQDIHSKKHTYPVIENDALDFMQKGYYGGRTEIFFNKPIAGNIQYFDFNSLYPSVNYENEYPIIKSGYHYFTESPDFKKEGVADVTIRTAHNLYIPYLPFRNPDGVLLFPLGTFRGVYSYYEIREAIKIGYEIIETHRAYEFSAGNFRPFKSYVETLYKKRLKAQSEKNILLSDNCKNLLNNLYGKWAQGDEKTTLVPFNPKIHLNTGATRFGNFILKQEKGEYPKHVNKIWSIYTTAQARHKLYLAMTEVLKHGGMLLYCDTDSVIFESNKKIIKNSDKLGALKLEGEFCYAYFKMPKQYVLVDKKGKRIYKVRGVPSRHAEEFFEKGSVTYKKPLKIREVLRRNMSPKNKINPLKINFWTDVTKENKKRYDKRKVKRDGTTQPIRLI